MDVSPLACLDGLEAKLQYDLRGINGKYFSSRWLWLRWWVFS